MDNPGLVSRLKAQDSLIALALARASNAASGGSGTMKIAAPGFVQPAVEGSVTIPLNTSAPANAPGNFLAVTLAGVANNYRVTSVPDATHVVAVNLGGSNAAAGTAFAVGLPAVAVGPADTVGTNRWFDVKEYGATNGDIGPGLQAAITAAGANCGGKVYAAPLLGSGHYAQVTPVNVNLVGLTPGLIDIEGAGTFIDLRLSDPTQFALAAENSQGSIHVRGFIWVGNPAIGQDAASTLGLGCQVSNIERCEFWGLSSTSNLLGIVDLGASQASMRDCYFAGCGFHGAKGGAVTINADNATFENVRMIDFNTLCGVGHVKDSGTAWVYVREASDITISGCFFDEAVDQQFWLDAAVAGAIGRMSVKRTGVNSSHVTASLFVSQFGAQSVDFEDCQFGQGGQGIPFADVVNLGNLTFVRDSFGSAPQGQGMRVVKTRTGCGIVEFTDCDGVYRLDCTSGAPKTCTETLNGITTLYPCSLPGAKEWLRADMNVHLNPTLDIGAAATYAPVVAGHHLDVQIDDLPAPTIVSFTGAENSQATFLASLNVVFGGFATNNGGQIQLEIPVSGGLFSFGAILGSSSADVLASLGLSVGAFSTPATVSEWEDNSGLADATHNLAVTGSSPTFELANAAFANQATVNSTGTDAMASPAWSSPLAQPFTVVVTGRQTAAALAYFFDSINPGAQVAIRAKATQDALEIFAGVLATVPTDTTRSAVYIVEFNGANSRIAISSDTFQKPFDAGANGLTGITVGQIAGGGANADTEIAEVVVYDHLLDLQERQEIVAYASRRWGIAETNPPMFTVYASDGTPISLYTWDPARSTGRQYLSPATAAAPSLANWHIQGTDAGLNFNAPQDAGFFTWDFRQANTFFGGLWSGQGLNLFFNTNLAATGGGTGVLVIHDGAAIPTANIAAAVQIYSEAGAAKVRGQGGTISTFGPAEPHCPVCGRDYMTEHENQERGEYLAVCLLCLADELGPRGWILRTKPTAH